MSLDDCCHDIVLLAGKGPENNNHNLVKCLACSETFVTSNSYQCIPNMRIEQYYDSTGMYKRYKIMKKIRPEGSQ
jgi:hypothetical protein